MILLTIIFGLTLFSYLIYSFIESEYDLLFKTLISSIFYILIILIVSYTPIIKKEHPYISYQSKLNDSTIIIDNKKYCFKTKELTKNNIYFKVNCFNIYNYKIDDYIYFYNNEKIIYSK